jgi:hypothetical protein
MHAGLVGTDLPQRVQVGKKPRRIDYRHIYAVPRGMKVFWFFFTKKNSASF